jgi:hypothetical protein
MFLKYLILIKQQRKVVFKNFIQIHYKFYSTIFMWMKFFNVTGQSFIQMELILCPNEVMIVPSSKFNMSYVEFDKCKVSLRCR